MRTTCRHLRSGKFSPVDAAARLGPRHPSATELHTSYHSFRYNHSDQIDVTWTSLSVPAFWCRRRHCPATMDRLAMECRYPPRRSRGDRGGVPPSVSRLGWVCLRRPRRNASKPGEYAQFLSVRNSSSGDCVQILGGAWAIRLDQLSLGFGDSPACVVLR